MPINTGWFHSLSGTNIRTRTNQNTLPESSKWTFFEQPFKTKHSHTANKIVAHPIFCDKWMNVRHSRKDRYILIKWDTEWRILCISSNWFGVYLICWSRYTFVDSHCHVEGTNTKKKNIENKTKKNSLW